MKLHRIPVVPVIQQNNSKTYLSSINIELLLKLYIPSEKIRYSEHEYFTFQNAIYDSLQGRKQFQFISPDIIISVKNDIDESFIDSNSILSVPDMRCLKVISGSKEIHMLDKIYKNSPTEIQEKINSLNISTSILIGYDLYQESLIYSIVQRSESKKSSILRFPVKGSSSEHLTLLGKEIKFV